MGEWYINLLKKETLSEFGEFGEIEMTDFTKEIITLKIYKENTSL